MAVPLKRAKLILSPDQLHAALGLCPTVRVTGFYLQLDPPQLRVMVEATWFNEQDPAAEAPVVDLEYVR